MVSRETAFVVAVVGLLLRLRPLGEEVLVVEAELGRLGGGDPAELDRRNQVTAGDDLDRRRVLAAGAHISAKMPLTSRSSFSVLILLAPFIIVMDGLSVGFRLLKRRNYPSVTYYITSYYVCQQTPSSSYLPVADMRK